MRINTTPATAKLKSDSESISICQETKNMAHNVSDNARVAKSVKYFRYSALHEPRRTPMYRISITYRA
jgi:hypothetical protein